MHRNTRFTESHYSLLNYYNIIRHVCPRTTAQHGIYECAAASRTVVRCFRRKPTGRACSVHLGIRVTRNNGSGGRRRLSGILLLYYILLFKRAVKTVYLSHDFRKRVQSPWSPRVVLPTQRNIHLSTIPFRSKI